MKGLPNWLKVLLGALGVSLVTVTGVQVNVPESVPVNRVAG